MAEMKASWRKASEQATLNYNHVVEHEFQNLDLSRHGGRFNQR